MAYALRLIGPYVNVKPTPAPTPAPAPAPSASRPTVAQFIANAKKFLGQPFAWGGGHGPTMKTPGPVDASGLVQQAARMSGFKLDGTTATQQTKGREVSMKALQPGDLVFHGTPATHVGIYLGNGQVIAASKPGTPVRITNLYYFDNARRVIEETAGNGVPTPAPAPKPVTPPGAYTVQYGDTLWGIAQRQLRDGNRWQEIYAMNPFTIQNPNHLVPGMVLKLPSQDPSGGSVVSTNPFFNDYDF
jgi:nucleoid-associated protein YgaU